MKNSGDSTQIISEATEKSNNYFMYYIRKDNGKIELVCEDDIKVQFTRDNPSPLKQMKNFELQNPIWYFNRRFVSDSLQTLKNATYGFETLLGSRVFLLPHQVDTIIRAVRENKCRFMLADEVGLGKTMVARGIIAKIIDDFQSKDQDRIDIIYICSNTQIARQNINRLNIMDKKLLDD